MATWCSNWIRYITNKLEKPKWKLKRKKKNPTGAENKQLKEFAPSKYKNQDDTTSTAKDFAILDHHVIKETPKILHFTKQLAPTQHGVTYYTFNHSLEGAKMSLLGTDGLKTGSNTYYSDNRSKYSCWFTW